MLLTLIFFVTFPFVVFGIARAVAFVTGNDNIGDTVGALCVPGWFVFYALVIFPRVQ